MLSAPTTCQSLGFVASSHATMAGNGPCCTLTKQAHMLQIWYGLFWGAALHDCHVSCAASTSLIRMLLPGTCTWFCAQCLLYCSLPCMTTACMLCVFIFYRCGNRCNLTGSELLLQAYWYNTGLSVCLALLASAASCSEDHMANAILVGGLPSMHTVHDTIHTLASMPRTCAWVVYAHLQLVPPVWN